MVLIHGIAHPRALVWRDSTTGSTHYITKVLGTEQKLFFLKELAPDEKPGILSVLEGHLLKWTDLPLTESTPIANALSAQYNIKIQPESTFVIKNNSRPKGCK